MGSKVEVFIIIRNLEVFGGQSLGFLYQGREVATLFYYVASCTRQTRIDLVHTTFQAEILNDEHSE
jgi:uncharacterized LabA/DUF88 family protein